MIFTSTCNRKALTICEDLIATVTNAAPKADIKIKHYNYLYTQGLQLGPTELSIYWLYWTPAQYVEAIKDTILGKWQIDQLQN